jgi:wyosine [tRNA(Phe)-imidazoG37] synthetase (radical SAM superfamily)
METLTIQPAVELFRLSLVMSIERDEFKAQRLRQAAFSLKGEPPFSKYSQEMAVKILKKPLQWRKHLYKHAGSSTEYRSRA